MSKFVITISGIYNRFGLWIQTVDAINYVHATYDHFKKSHNYKKNSLTNDTTGNNVS